MSLTCPDCGREPHNPRSFCNNERFHATRAPAEPTDGEMLDWLEKLLKKSGKYWPQVHIDTLRGNMKIGACNKHHGVEAGSFVAETLRDAIKAAMKGDK